MSESDVVKKAAYDATWLDDFWSVVLAVPLLAAFMPGLQDVVSRGFQIIGTDAPGWYLGSVGLAVAWAFGRRALPPITATLRPPKGNL